MDGPLVAFLYQAAAVRVRKKMILKMIPGIAQKWIIINSVHQPVTTDDNYGTFSLAIATMYVIRERGRKSNTVKFQNTFAIYETTIKGSDAGTGGARGARGATAPPIFC